MIVRGFEWDSVNEAHIMKKHNILLGEAEEVFVENPIIRITRDDRRVAFGKTIGGRYLIVVFEKKSKGIIRVITARNMIDSERRYYKKMKGFS